MIVTQFIAYMYFYTYDFYQHTLFKTLLDVCNVKCQTDWLLVTYIDIHCIHFTVYFWFTIHNVNTVLNMYAASQISK